MSEDTLYRSWGCTAAVHVPYGAGGRCDTAAAAGAAAAAAAAAAGGSALIEGS